MAGPGGGGIGGDVACSTIIAGPVHIHWTAATAPTRPEFRRLLRMLAVVAAPVVGFTEADPPPAPLDLWAEWRRLEEAVRSAGDVVRDQGAPWAVVRLNPPTRAALADALATGEADAAYQVVHFSGHGAPDGLAFEDDLGHTDFVTDDQLVDLLRGRPVRLVVLNACETETIAEQLHQEAGVPAVIATTDLLRDDEARLPTPRRYAWLARARSGGLDPQTILVRNDSYSLFDRVGDHFRPGPTGTNVMDLKLALILPDGRACRRGQRRHEIVWQ